MAQQVDKVMHQLSLYRGRRISVISNSDIRYEGWLKNLFAERRTISVDKVRFCGTEFRRADKPVAARSEMSGLFEIELCNAKEIFVHLESTPEICKNSAGVETSDAVIPILWTTARPESPEASVVPEQQFFSHELPFSTGTADSIHGSAWSLRPQLASLDDKQSEKERITRKRRAPIMPEDLSLDKAKTRFVAKGDRGMDGIASSESGSGSSVRDSMELELLDVVRSAMEPNSSDAISPKNDMNGSLDHAGGKPLEGADGVTIFDVMWSDTYCPCPVPSCGSNHSTTSMYKMEQHFMKCHITQYPRYQLRLHCPRCDAYGFQGRIPDLRVHLESKHGWTNGLPPRGWKKGLLTRSLMELDGTGAKRRNESSKESAVGSSSKKFVRAAAGGGKPSPSTTDSSSDPEQSLVSLGDQQPKKIHRERKRNVPVAPTSAPLSEANKGQARSLTFIPQSLDSADISDVGYVRQPSVRNPLDVSHVVRSAERLNIDGSSVPKGTKKMGTARDQILEEWKKRLNEVQTLLQRGVDCAYPIGNNNIRRFRPGQITLTSVDGVFCKAIIVEYHPMIPVQTIFHAASPTCIVHYYGRSKDEDEERAENELFGLDSATDAAGMLFAHEWNTLLRKQRGKTNLDPGSWCLSDEQLAQLEGYWQKHAEMNVSYGHYCGRRQAEAALARLPLDG